MEDTYGCNLINTKRDGRGNQGVGECNHFLHQFHVLHLLVWTDLGRLSTNGAQEAKGGKNRLFHLIIYKRYSQSDIFIKKILYLCGR